VTATAPSVPGLYVGTSGWSYPSWKPGFYPGETRPADFLTHYATRLPAVELNTTGYRLPAEGQFERWAEQTPAGFRFAPKLNAYRSTDAATFEERVRRLGDRLGPIRALVGYARDEGLLALLLGSLDPALQVAFDFRHGSWEGIETDLPPNATTINDLDGGTRFRYLRLREPPYDDAALRAWADRIRPLLEDGIEVYVFFKHEEEPRAPRDAERLLALLSD
jgi:uncharacterized protein YecE (DUF72 family)